ncbi:CPBP family intramembrane glutamic endopeptidase [Butyrivibrio sp. INlla16]|uniref:CPBP family intramembrane glutamic endopeptidase n=1 Tax=Butyrivibrio sp. INlla16 TaxID=1520807 RepID=UPI0008816C12|nr:CPBP family intramembrane glutamic endopeptidase [Butyrivibrio sp. INlla16]SDB08346.1 CAAX protease self-immunity [Butyrivibrio sp. INlla16]
MKTTKGSKAKAIFAAIGIMLLFLGIQAIIGAVGTVGASALHYAQTGEAFATNEEYMEYISGILTVLQFVGEIACIVVFGLWYYLGSVKKDQKLGTYESGLKKISNVNAIAFLVCISLGFYTFDLIISKITTVLIPGSSELFSQLMGLVTGGNQIVAVLTVALFAPIAEELAFRGVMLKSSKKAFAIVGCVILSALMFAIMHMNPMQSLYALPIGLALAFVGYKFNSVIPAIVIHIINNTVAIVVPSVLGRPLSMVEAVVVCAIFMALTVFTYKKLAVKDEQVEATEISA